MQPEDLPPDLSDGLYEPLHILEPGAFNWTALLWFLALVAALLLLQRWLRPKPLETTVPKTTAPPLPPVPTGGFERFLLDLRTRHRTAEDYRPALHELAAGLREFCERKPRGQGFSSLTATEIAGRLGASAVARIFEMTAELQFGRKAPTKDDFNTLCELSRDAVKAEDW